MRVSNLARLRLDTQIHLPQSGAGETVVLVPSSETKGRSTQQHLLPPETPEFVLLYLSRVRPIIDDRRLPWLFPNGRGHHKRPDTVSKQLSALILDNLGLEYSPHLQRHLTARIKADATPGDMESIRLLLGHASIETTARFYTGLQTNNASRSYSDLIRAKRQQIPDGEEGPGKWNAVKRRKPKSKG